MPPAPAPTLAQAAPVAVTSSVLLHDANGLNVGLRKTESQEACHSMVTIVLPGDLPALLQKLKGLHKGPKERNHNKTQGGL